MEFLLKISDVVEVEEKDGEVTLVRAAPMQCDNHVKELVANQVDLASILMGLLKFRDRVRAYMVHGDSRILGRLYSAPECW